MNDYTKMIVHKFPDGKDITIYPISDVHLGAAEHMCREWANFCKRVQSEPGARIILAGDLINNALKNSVSDVYAETMRPREQKQRMIEMLTPLREKILCAVGGNHERRSGRDADNDITYDIMCKLDLEHLYREDLCFMKLQMGDVKGAGQRNPTYMLGITHGAGGGALTGGGVNRFERFGYAVDGIDALICGHTHKPLVTAPAKIYVNPQTNKVTIKQFRVIVSTSWLNYGGYAAAHMLPPTSHAPQTLTLCGDHKEMLVTM